MNCINGFQLWKPLNSQGYMCVPVLDCSWNSLFMLSIPQLSPATWWYFWSLCKQWSLLLNTTLQGTSPCDEGPSHDHHWTGALNVKWLHKFTWTADKVDVWKFLTVCIQWEKCYNLLLCVQKAWHCITL